MSLLSHILISNVKKFSHQAGEPSSAISANVLSEVRRSYSNRHHHDLIGNSYMLSCFVFAARYSRSKDLRFGIEPIGPPTPKKTLKKVCSAESQHGSIRVPCHAH